jgi:AcrR family transcriptional regulator
MTDGTVGRSRGRLVAAAARLFAERGYAATSVADIQQACGLTGGSGALYKHFASKRALLEAVVGLHVQAIRDSRDSFVEQVPDDLTAALRMIAAAVWAAMRRGRDALRVILRDLDAYPDLRDTVWAEVLAGTFGEFARWLRLAAGRGLVRVTDPEATSAVLLASLICYPVLGTLLDRPPGDIAAGRFLEAWIAHAAASLAPGDVGAGTARPAGA